MSENDTNQDVPGQLGDERSVPSVNKRKKNGKAGKIAGAAAMVCLVLVMAWMQFAPKGAPEARKEEESTQARRGLPDLTMPVVEAPPPPPAEVPPPAPAAPPAPAGNPNMGYQEQQRQPTEAELLLERRKRAPIFAFGNAGGQAAGDGNTAGGAASLDAGNGGSLGGDGEDGPDRDSLAVNLQSTKFDSSRASMLTNRNFLLTAGTMLDCTLVTALDSTLPGKTKCQLSRNIYSDNGKVLLLERGSIVEGEYRSGQMRQGMNRIFVLWTRVRTPRGVQVPLDSPGADELGRSGLSGWVETHFWKRYGSALMLSLVDDTAEYLVQKQRSQGGDSISFSGAGDATSQAAAIALQNSINIPPTLNKNQGDIVNIYVARDLDFRSVYDLRSN